MSKYDIKTLVTEHNADYYIDMGGGKLTIPKNFGVVTRDYVVNVYRTKPSVDNNEFVLYMILRNGSIKYGCENSPNLNGLVLLYNERYNENSTPDSFGLISGIPFDANYMICYTVDTLGTENFSGLDKLSPTDIPEDWMIVYFR